MIQFIPPDQIEAAWPQMIAVLEPAFHYSSLSRQVVLADLISGEKAAFRMTDGGEGYVVAKWGYPEGSKDLTLWVLLAAGFAAGTMKQRAACMCARLHEIEQVARNAACKAVRIEGRRGWARVLPHYTVIDAYGDNYVYERALA